MRFLRGSIAVLVLAVGCVLPGCQSAALTSAKLYLQEDDPARARVQLEKAIATTPEDGEAHFLLGKVQAMEGDWQAMAASLDRCAELTPKYSADISRLRTYYWTQRYNEGIRTATASTPDYAGANQAFTDATIIDPHNVSGWRNLAFTYYQLGDPGKAIQAYQAAAQVAPEDTLVLSSLATMYVQEGRHQEAAATLRTLVELTPGDASAWVNLGIALQALDRLADAQDAFQAAIAADPSLALAHYGLGNLFWKQDRIEEARDAYLRACELAPDDQDARFNLAMAHLHLEDDAAALPLLEQLSREMPDNGAVWRQLSLIYARQERLTAATAADAKAKALGY